MISRRDAFRLVAGGVTCAALPGLPAPPDTVPVFFWDAYIGDALVRKDQCATVYTLGSELCSKITEMCLGPGRWRARVSSGLREVWIEEVEG